MAGKKRRVAIGSPMALDRLSPSLKEHAISWVHMYCSKAFRLEITLLVLLFIRPTGCE